MIHLVSWKIVIHFEYSINKLHVILLLLELFLFEVVLKCCCYWLLISLLTLSLFCNNKYSLRHGKWRGRAIEETERSKTPKLHSKFVVTTPVKHELFVALSSNIILHFLFFGYHRIALDISKVIGWIRNLSLLLLWDLAWLPVECYSFCYLYAENNFNFVFLFVP